jgi:hypothetical protein
VSEAPKEVLPLASTCQPPALAMVRVARVLIL